MEKRQENLALGVMDLENAYDVVPKEMNKATLW